MLFLLSLMLTNLKLEQYLKSCHVSRFLSASFLQIIIFKDCAQKLKQEIGQITLTKERFHKSQI